VSFIDSSYKTQTSSLTLPSVIEMAKWLDALALRKREAMVKFSLFCNETIFSYATIKGYLKHGRYEVLRPKGYNVPSYKLDERQKVKMCTFAE
jgi:hypothetical protein